MQNIPIFTAANGMASLVLREIPYSGTAYVMLRAVWNGKTEALLEECGGFCRSAGAETVYASDGMNDLPADHAYDILRLYLCRQALPPLQRQVELVPVSAENGSAYLRIYNACFRTVPGAASYDRKDLKRLMEQGTGFLAVDRGEFAGVVELERDGIAGIAVLPTHKGLGYDLALTALHRLQADVLQLKVADTNIPALKLYRRLGFGEDTTVSRWWRL